MSATKPARQRKHTTRPPARDAAADAGQDALTPALAPGEAEPVARPDAVALPIVAIGASAGGLEALEQFLRHTPVDSGIAFVVIQHLDPTQKGMLVELLQRATAMPVLQVTDGLRVEANSVYVIPPNRDMSILHGVLQLFDPVMPRGLRLPIDAFFRSLADDAQERAIGVILSGMGSDGTLGLRAIKEKAGAVFVQTAATAAFDGMPRSAIDAGLADVIALVEELPGKILGYLQHVSHDPNVIAPDIAEENKSQSALDKVYTLLRSQTGHDFSLYKNSTITRRIERRMGLHQIDRISNYIRYLQENHQEVDLLFKELLIGVTNFFRDTPVWEQLKTVVLPMLLANRPANQPVRAWIPGCSTGEEAYSLAIVFKEALELQQLQQSQANGAGEAAGGTLQVFATDLDREAIDRARRGVYPASIAADVSPERLRRFFVQEEGSYRVNKDIREMVVFAPQNVVMDPPFTKLDLLSCRNLLIYLMPEPQKKLIQLFFYSLKPGGVLLLGSAETIGARADLFAPLDAAARLYQRLEPSAPAEAVTFPIAVPDNPLRTDLQKTKVSGPVTNLQTLADQVLLQTFAPAAVLVNESGDILYISGRTGKYLEPAAGQANWNIFAMAREGLRVDLYSAFQKATRQKETVVARGIKVGTNGGTQFVDLTIRWLAEPEGLRGMVMVVFTDVATPLSGKTASGKGRAGKLEQALEQARDHLQATREEMQSTQEELKSANEEMQSTNEELQSTNEELTTSKEEMQSMNEELQTVNHELVAKVDELSRSNNDMKNLLNSTEIATLFLDNALRVRRFTTQTARIINLIPGDIGRAITDIASDLLYPELSADVDTVLQTLVFSEKPISTRDGRWFKVRIMPYRTLDNHIDGVVITFSDITAAKVAEVLMRDTDGYLRQLMNSMPQLFWVCNPDGACDSVSRQWIDYTGIPEAGLLGYGWIEALHAGDRERVKAEWAMLMAGGVTFDIEFRIRNNSGAYRQFQAHQLAIRDIAGKQLKWYGYCTDIDSDPIRSS